MVLEGPSPSHMTLLSLTPLQAPLSHQLSPLFLVQQVEVASSMSGTLPCLPPNPPYSWSALPLMPSSLASVHSPRLYQE